MVGNVVGRVRIGADHRDGQHVQMLHPAVALLSLVRDVATGAVFGKQRTTLGGQRLVDRPEQLLGPGGRLQALQGFFDFIQVAHAHAGGVAVIALQRLAVGIEEVQSRADAQSLSNIARHRLLRRTVPLHPVKRPHVPQLRVVHRRVGHAIVGGGNRVAECRVGNSPERIGTAWAFLSWVKAAVSVVPGDFQKGVQRGFEILAQLFVASVVVIAQNASREAFEFPRVVVSRGQTGDQCLSETATA